MRIMIDGTSGRRPWSVRRTLGEQFRARSATLFEANQGSPAARNAVADLHSEYALSSRSRTLPLCPDRVPGSRVRRALRVSGGTRMRSLSAGLGTARTQTYARTLLGLVVAVAAFGAGNFAHAQPGQESSPTSTSRAAEGGYRIVEFSRPLPRAPLAAGGEREPAAAAARILEVSFGAGTGAARWYPPRRSIEVAVKFDRAVTVSTAAGIPQIDLALGTRLLGHARYASGSGSAELIFQYVTGDWNQALSDIAVGASSLSLNGGRIDSLGDATAADLAHAAGRLDNAGARPDSAADNSFLVAASGSGASANRVALPPAVLRTPLPEPEPGRRAGAVTPRPRLGRRPGDRAAGERRPGRRAGVGHGAGAAPGVGTAARAVVVPATRRGQPVGGPGTRHAAPRPRNSAATPSWHRPTSASTA